MSAVDVAIDILAIIGLVAVGSVVGLIFMLHSSKWCVDDPYDKAESEGSEDERDTN